MITVAARGPFLAAWIAAIAVPVAGCGDSEGSASSEEATVKGVVRIHGKALSGGTITFHPANINRKDAAPRSAAIGAGGAYEVRTLVGGNSVAVNGPEVRRYPGLEYEELTYYAEAGEGTFDIDMSPPTAAGPSRPASRR